MNWSVPENVTKFPDFRSRKTLDLMEKYKKLTEVQRVTLDLFAISANHLDFYEILYIFEGHSVWGIKESPLGKKYNFHPSKDRLAIEKNGFLEPNFTLNYPRLVPEFLLALCWDFYREGRWEELTNQLGSRFCFYVSTAEIQDLKRRNAVELRIYALDSLFRKNTEGFLAACKYWMKVNNSNNSTCGWLTVWHDFVRPLFESPFDPQFFNALPPEIQKKYYELRLETAVAGLEILPQWIETPIREYVETAIPSAAAKDPMVLRWIQYLMFRADYAEVRRLLAIPKSKIKPSLQFQIEAGLAFFECKIDEANQKFREAEALELKTTQKNNEFEPFFEVLHILCGFHREDLNWNWTENVLKRHLGETYGAFSILKSLVNRLNMIDPNGRKYVLQQKAEELNPGIPIPFVRMLQTAQPLWFGEQSLSYIDSAIKLLEYETPRFRKEFPWFQMESRNLMNNLCTRQSELKTNSSTHESLTGFFTSLIKFRERWDLVKNALQTLQKKPEDSVVEETPKEQKTRMTWRFALEEDEDFLIIEDAPLFFLEPWEQTRRTNGNWTVGKKISTKTLFLNWKEMPYLTERDRAIISSLHPYHTTYSNTEYYIFRNDVLPYLVGHPLIFSQKNPTLQLTFKASAPHLEVVDCNGKSVIRIRPFPQDLEGKSKVQTTVIRETPDSKDRFEIITFEPVHLQVAKLLQEEGLEIPVEHQEEVGAFLEPVLPYFKMKVKSQVSKFISQAENVENVEPDSRIHLFLKPENDGLNVHFQVLPNGPGQPPVRPGLGNSTIFWQNSDGSALCTERKFQEEKKNLRRVFDACPILSEAWRVDENDDQYLFRNSDDGFQFLAELEPIVSNAVTSDSETNSKSKSKSKSKAKSSVKEEENAQNPETEMEEPIQTSSLVVHWPKGERKRVSSITTSQNLNFSFSSTGAWFEAQGTLNVDQKSVDLVQILLAMEQSKSRFVEIRPNEFVSLSSQFRDKLEEFRMYTRFQGKKLRIHPLAVPAIDASMGENAPLQLGKLTTSEEWKQTVQRFRTAGEETVKLPKTFQGNLRDYQQEGFEWLSRLASWGAGACLADDMGLGKTIQSIAVLLSRASKGPALVVAPTSVCANWEREIERFAPVLNVIRVASYSETGGKIDRSELILNRKPFDVLLTNYAILQREAETFAKPHFATIVLDEAQAIKNHQAERTQAVLQLQSDFRFITTGTPIENNLSELWSLFEFINPGFLGTKADFDRKFAKPIQINDSQVARKQLKRLVKPFILRRFKSDVLTELPPKTEIQLEVELSDEERTIYEAIRRNALKQLKESNDAAGAKRIQILAELMRLRRACCHPSLVLSDSKLSGSKLDVLTSTVQDLLSANHKILVFSQFVDYLQIIAKRFTHEKIGFQYLDGSMTQKKRQEAVDSFQTGEDGVFLISLKAGGFGLNLTAADYVIHADPWWNPAVENQASDRVHRIGQKRPVTIYKMITRGTIEEKIIELHQRKDQLAQEILSETGSPSHVSLEELLSLLEF